ncbi:hypothetical protein L228DRAFT_261372 [Xylona heveae TC161]|uniref:Uncharacterized protein n=1 Tax=Xylona heveae (strain CBS 132557 / TC161) TaxID=1328760 RepID=A0A165GGJ6_XYLHT|nr:hypothetical protein L228DRAFT_261372 [Xylona heveae TC161]KZF22160.1 hypothetical protein L228DRAFT_261372 [Xylona heveae TC161]
MICALEVPEQLGGAAVTLSSATFLHFVFKRSQWRLGWVEKFQPSLNQHGPEITWSTENARQHHDQAVRVTSSWNMGFLILTIQGPLPFNQRNLDDETDRSGRGDRALWGKEAGQSPKRAKRTFSHLRGCLMAFTWTSGILRNGFLQVLDVQHRDSRPKLGIWNKGSVAMDGLISDN